MPRCEDFPACGHGPVPYGDGGGCPDKQGRFDCVICGKKLRKGNRSSICNACLNSRKKMVTDGLDDHDHGMDY